MNLSGIPTTPVSAGSTICVTVNGAVATPSASSSGSMKVLSISQSPVRPDAWIICVSVGNGYGKLFVEDGKSVANLALVGK